MNDDTRVSQLAEYHRFYGDTRFKQLTLFTAAMSAAGAGVMQYPVIRWWIALGALFVTGVMWVVEVRATLGGIAARNAIPELFPPSHKIKIFWREINSSYAVLLLHIAFYVLWLECIRAWGPSACFLLPRSTRRAYALYIFRRQLGSGSPLRGSMSVIAC